jgi:hypothetical protein
MNLFKIYLLFFLIFGAKSVLTQSVISLQNPSFEGEPRYSRLPPKWRVCSPFNQTPPDTQPGAFEVTKKAYDGETYVGMIVREDGTWESFGQSLGSPNLKGHCYQFSIDLGRSKQYLSLTRKSRKRKTNYIDPVKFRIWGGTDICEKIELLAETTAITHYDWRRYEFNLKPHTDCTFLMFEVFSPHKILGGANGHILLDAASNLILLEGNSSGVKE